MQSREFSVYISRNNETLQEKEHVKIPRVCPQMVLRNLPYVNMKVKGLQLRLQLSTNMRFKLNYDTPQPNQILPHKKEKK